MRVFQIEGDWGIQNLKLSTRPDPSPLPGQVLIRMQASSVNYRDPIVPERAYGVHSGTLPLIPVSDGMGIIAAVGTGVTRFNVGDRVCPAYFQSWISGEPTAERLSKSLGGPIDGTMAQYMCLSEEGVVRIPDYLSAIEAASLPCAAVTAWSALTQCSTLKPGDHLLIQGSGGVALFALQFAKIMGVRVTVISSDDAKIERLKDMGADHTINYTSTPEWAKASREITAGQGFDHILEVGGEKTLPQSLRCIRPGGTLSMIGILSGSAMATSLGLIITRQVRLQGVTVGHRDAFESMLRAMAQHNIRPVIDRVFGFSELKESFSYLKSGAQFGKICINHDE